MPKFRIRAKHIEYLQEQEIVADIANDALKEFNKRWEEGQITVVKSNVEFEDVEIEEE